MLQHHLDADPEDAAAWALYGKLLLDMDETEVARIALEEALFLAPDDLGAACALAEVERRQGELVAGLARLGEVLKFLPEHPEASRLARIMVLQRFALGDAAAVLPITADQAVPVARACSIIGRALSEAHMRKEAVCAFQLAAQALPDDYNSLNDLACALLRSIPAIDGGHEESNSMLDARMLRALSNALMSYLRCIEIAPKSALAYKNLGSLLTNLARRGIYDAEGAAAYTQIKAFQLEPEDYSQRLLAASLLFDLKQLEASAALYSGENIIPGGDEEEDGGRWRLDVFVKGFTQGIDKIEEQILVSVDPARRAEALIRVGDILVGLGMEGEAVLFFALALQDEPDNIHCREAVRAAMSSRRLLHEAIAVSTGDRSILPPPLVMAWP
ncbi:hypothetical protein A6A04_10600 [Paramagnetospirillum marisnigri]|uniref:Tetratricopeptide repeat protein n=1 Tax=Paramagnetospirillum marisnigri TaxID=1285242 RepID=A0A178N096_9PROT|nr:hypothetical protein [Paramagnetospirillum marisnigri]OAN56000.1 hypothetical protein A6A04_10600 [Paramagnetospirillum marisnigri]